jgi:nicotinamidase-related amidase
MLRCVELGQRFTGDVILSCFKHEAGGFMEQQLNWNRFEDEVDTALIPEAAALDKPKYWRTTYNCLTDEVKSLAVKYDHIYLAGVFTDVSVFVTASAIFDLGIPVTVIRDCVATLHGEQVQAYSLRSLEYMLDKKNVLSRAELPDGLIAKKSKRQPH